MYVFEVTSLRAGEHPTQVFHTKYGQWQHITRRVKPALKAALVQYLTVAVITPTHAPTPTIWVQ